MTYEKKLMSVTELTKYGYSREYLYTLAHHRLAPKYVRGTKGKILFDTEELEKYIHLIR